MQQDVEVGEIPQEDFERKQTLAVAWTVKYLLKDGLDFSDEMVDMAYGILGGVAQQASAGTVPSVSALHTMALVLEHRGQHGFAKAYERMARHGADQLLLTEQIGIEYQ